MIKDIYIRNESDPSFIPNVIDYQNDVENVLSQIRMILGTRKGQILGMYHFGVDIEDAVFGTKKSAEEVGNEIQDQIDQYVIKPSNITISVQVSFGDSGEGYDYAVIDILLNGVKTMGFLVDQ